MAEINRNDFIEDGFFDSLSDGAKEAKKALDELNKTLTNYSKTAKQVAAVSGESVEDQMQLTKALNDTNNARKSSMKVEEQSIKLKKQLDAATDEEVKSKLRLQEASKQQKQVLRDEIALEDKQIGTLKKLQIQNKQLRRERENLNLETENGRKRLLAINAQLDRNNITIKKNADAMKRQRLNVGAYGKAVSRVTTMLKGFGATMLASLSIQAVGSFFSSSIKGWRDQQKAIAKVEQGIKSTGGAADRTSEQLQKMASSLQKNTLFGDEDILNNVTAQLLTFTNISGEQFDRTQKVALDLATVLDGDLKSASIQLGKALNDPVANLSALSRSGIQFSKEQKEVIKTLAEGGKLAEAQSVILEELERQYGGQAQAAAKADGGVKQFQNAWGDFKEQVGKAILPALSELLGHLTKVLDVMKGNGSVIDIMPEFIGKWEDAFDSLENFNDALLSTLEWFSNFIPGMSLVTKRTREYVDELQKMTPEQEKQYEIQKRQNQINSEAVRIGGELIKQNREELSDVSVLIDALMDENTTREEKNEIIEKLNEDYPELVGNIDLETASTERLIQVKKDLVKQILSEAIERKKAEALSGVTGRILELELQKLGAGDKGIAELDRQIKELTHTIPLIEEVTKTVTDNLEKTVDGLDFSTAFRDTNDEVSNLKDELIKLNQELVEAQADGDAERIEGIKKRIATVNEQLTNANTLRQKMLDDALDKEVESYKSAESGKTNAVKKGVEERLNLTQEELDRMGEEFEYDLDSIFRELDNVDFEGPDLFEIGDFVFNDEASNEALKNIEKLEKAEQRRKQALQESVKESVALFKTLTKSLEKEIDARIKLRQEELAETDKEINRLKDLAAQGDVNAAKSLKAEEEKRARQKEDINELERKKTNLLIVTTALGQVQQNLNSGDKQSFQNSLASVTEFFSKLPKFYDGSGKTIGEALGKTNTRDGHLIWADDSEFLHGAEESKKLARAGFGTTSEIARAALDYKDISLGRSVKAASFTKSMTDRRIVAELQGVKDAVKNIRIVQQHIDLASMSEVIKDGNTTTKNTYIKKGFEI